MRTMTEIATGTLAAEKPERVFLMGAHLTEEQIDAELLGDLGEQPAEHLASCAECTERVTQAAVPLASFRATTMAWSERRSATMPMPAVEAQGLVWQRRMRWVMASFVLGAGIVLVNYRHNEMTASVQEAQAAAPQDAVPVAPVKMASAAPTLLAATTAVAQTASVAADNDRFAADNTMLKAVAVELNASVDSPAVLGLEAASVDDQSDDAAAQTSLRD
jgi:hypothetical protein